MLGDGVPEEGALRIARPAREIAELQVAAADYLSAIVDGETLSGCRAGEVAEVDDGANCGCERHRPSWRFHPQGRRAILIATPGECHGEDKRISRTAKHTASLCGCWPADLSPSGRPLASLHGRIQVALTTHLFGLVPVYSGRMLVGEDQPEVR